MTQGNMSLKSVEMSYRTEKKNKIYPVRNKYFTHLDVVIWLVGWLVSLFRLRVQSFSLSDIQSVS